MNTENVIVMGFTIFFTIANIIMLRYEWMKIKGTENEIFWKFPKWLWFYGGIMLVVQVGDRKSVV